jgi:CubicO group peptidase (beta-lactamase class C family)
MYDLASVTKVVAGTTACMVLYERGIFHLEQKIAEVLPEFANKDDSRRQAITFQMLLAHSSGLPAYVKLFDSSRNKDELVRQAAKVSLVAGPGSHAEYSDIGFILLGVALERLAQEPLDKFCYREIFAPLGLGATVFNPPPDWKTAIPPTVHDSDFRHRVIQGEVHDENAWVMGGISGHAGVFATAQDVSMFTHCMLSGGAPLVRQETVQLFTHRQPGPAGSSRALGWDTPSHPSQSGRYFSASSYGHLGYTGTSLWVDPERQLSVTLLTNRTWPDRQSQKIKEIRPAFHDAVIEALT